MALLNIRQSLGVHGCNGSVRYWEVDCTGNPEFELMADIARGILDGKKLLELCPALEPGHIIRINRVFPNGKIVPSGMSYTVVAKDTNNPYEVKNKNFIYAVCHNNDEFVLFEEVGNIGVNVDARIDNEAVCLYSRFGTILLDKVPAQSEWVLREAGDTANLDAFGGDVTFPIDSAAGSIKVKERNYYSNRIIYKQNGAGGNAGKRAVVFAIGKNKDFLTFDFFNQTGMSTTAQVLHEYIISGRLVRVFVSFWSSGATGGNGNIRLTEIGGRAVTTTTQWGTAFVPLTNGDEIFTGVSAVWQQTSGTSNSIRLDGYAELYFDPIPNP